MTNIDQVSTKTRRARVWRMLLDGKWHTTMDINDVAVGGSEGCRRLRELRGECSRGKLPGVILKRRVRGKSTQYEYRLVVVPI